MLTFKMCITHVLIILLITLFTGVFHTLVLIRAARYKELEGNYTVFDLDKRINDLIRKPEFYKSYELYQLVYTIHLEMLHVHEVVNFNINDTTAQNLARQIVQNNGLLIFNLTINEDELKEKYNYNKAEVYEIVDLVKNCQRLYNTTAPIIKACAELTKNMTVFDMDEMIHKLMLRPQSDKGDETKQLLSRVHSTLTLVLEVVTKGLDNPEAIALGKKIIENKGLKIFQAPLCEELLKVTNKWTNKMYIEFEDLIMKCKNVFSKIEMCIVNKGL